MNKDTLELLMQASEFKPALWAEKYQLKNELGLPLDFTYNHRFMRPIFNDMSRFQVILKPPQVGATTTQILKALYMAKKTGKQIIYTLPTESDMYEMVSGTFNRLIAQNPVLQSWVKEGDTMSHKFVGNSVIRFRGTSTSKQAMMYPSNLNIHDEVDASDPQVITLMETRLAADAEGMRWYFSHPSITGAGVDIQWQKSDKKEWAVTCPACQQRQVMTWPKSISREKMAYVCKACDEVLSDRTRIMGDWYKTSEGQFAGYHISQLMLYNKTAKDILDAYDDPQKDKQFFWNYVLGLPYQGGDDQITAEQVLANCTNSVNTQSGKIIIGVDPGLPVHYVAMNAEGLFFFNVCKPPSATDDGYEDIRRLMRMWPQAIVISDQGGDLTPMRKMQADFPGRVFLAFYRKDRKTDALWKWGEGLEYGTVTIDRNRAIQLLVQEFKEGGRLRLNGTHEEFKEYADHWATLYREKIVVKEQKDKDDRSLYGAEYVWKRRGADHWAHATLYARVGMEKYGQSLAKINAPDILSTMKEGLMDTNFTGNVILRSLSDDSIRF